MVNAPIGEPENPGRGAAGRNDAVVVTGSVTLP